MDFINYYHCSCGEEWVDCWNCTCNSRCPVCNKEIEPFRSDDFPRHSKIFENPKKNTFS